MVKLLMTVLAVLLSSSFFNQKESSLRTFNLLRTYQSDQNLIVNLEDSPLGVYNRHLKSVQHLGVPLNVNFQELGDNNAYYSIIKGDKLLAEQNSSSSDSLAYLNYEKAYFLGREQNDTLQQAEAVKRILLHHLKSQKNLDIYSYWVRQYKEIAYDDFEHIYSEYFQIGLLMSKAYYQNENTLGIEQRLLKNIKKAKEKNYKYLEARLLQLLGNYIDLFSSDKDSLDYQIQALEIYQNNSVYAFQKHVNDMLFNIAYYYDQKNDNLALEYLSSINLEEIERKELKDKELIYDLYYRIFKKKNLIDSSLYYLEKKYEIVDSINAHEKSLIIQDINTKYQTAEKEKQILIEQAGRKQEAEGKIKNRNISIALGSSLVFLSIIGILIYRNTKRKQRIAEQEKELQIQKTTSVLKEQEISTINAMVEGQEKERLRLARDLHDNLGGTLAAVKMHIGNLQNNLHKSQNPKELLDKANLLIAEAYTNVRSIAHERNSGVMAKEGLLPAIQKLASKVSSSGGLKIEFQDFGLEERLSNHLEITIFRIVQELVTNVIKHANATELSISLTQHEKDLNIVVEDNGKGFIVGKLTEKDGMGLGSIERRVEHLEGAMEVDSSLEIGTSIIIDIPI